MRTAGTLPTVIESFAITQRRVAEGVALRVEGDGRRDAITWLDYGLHVRQAALGLVDAGIEAGQRVSVPTGGSHEWGWRVADLAVMSVGAIAVVGAPAERTITLTDLGGKEGTLSLAGLQARGVELDRREPDRYERLWRALEPEQPALELAGALLSHGNISWTLNSLRRVLPLGEGDRLLCGASDAHPTARLVGHLAHVESGAQAWSMTGHVRDVSRECRPTVAMAAASTCYELAARVVDVAGARRGPQRWAARRLLAGDANTRTTRTTRTERPSARRVLDRVVGRRLRADLGLDHCRVVLAIGRPVDLGVILDLADAGVLVTQPYGSAAACGLAAFSGDDGRCIGTPGPPMPGVDLGIADDGEILVRGGNVSADALAEGEWLHTGDHGNLNAEGCLVVAPAEEGATVHAG